MRVCPKCGGEKFIVIGIQHHDWIVTGEGEFIEDDGLYEAKRAENTDWECTNCGAEYASNSELKEV